MAKELIIAAKAPGREGWEDARRYYAYQMKLLGVDVNLGVEVTPEMVLEGDWDAVVVATGALPFIPEFPGSDSENVVEMHQVLQDKVKVGDTIVIVAYKNHMRGLATADFLAHKAKRVELLNESIYLGGMADHHALQTIHTRLYNKGAVITPLSGVKEVQGNTVVTYNTLTGIERQIKGVETVVFCTDGRANDALHRSLKEKGQGTLRGWSVCITTALT